MLQDLYADHSESKEPTVNKKLRDERFDELKGMNEDYVGWITIEDSKINYPVVKGRDNNYYLTHNFYKEHDFVGAIFMDYRNSGTELDQQTVIYGHYMKDNSMFGQLKKYLDSEFYKKRKTIQTDFQGSTYEWEIFSIYVSDDSDPLEVESVDSYLDYITSLKERSLYSTETNVGEEDRILTLSTCTNEVETERMIVHAKLINKEVYPNNEE